MAEAASVLVLPGHGLGARERVGEVARPPAPLAPPPASRACGCRLQRGTGPGFAPESRPSLHAAPPDVSPRGGAGRRVRGEPPSQSTAGLFLPLSSLLTRPGHSELSRRSTASAETRRGYRGALSGPGTDS